MSQTPISPARRRATKELAIFSLLFLAGLVLLPLLIYTVGQAVFGEYGGHAYSDFFGTLSEKIRRGDKVAWFLALSPYLGLQSIRLCGLLWRAVGRTGHAG